ncbi:MAG: 23S rRNA pseudouridine(1911/1915/1917) synthase RluD [Coxiellaceae bacterium]|jgi:23S rRNA pseudouridine1911/1915/1917 synthase|nr:23S rRNA pseudouridine(1911/1915/1917) synthase RluD [Coxiellaceae bacterium]
MSINTSSLKLTKSVPETLAQKRFDVVLSNLLPEYSRAQLQKWIKAGYVTINGKRLRPKDKVEAHQVVKVNATILDLVSLQPQQIALDIVYEDQDVIIINKPAGLVTHPGAGNMNNTLLNALLYHYPDLAKLPRVGIIHRLDEDTSGIIVVARNLQAHNKLTKDLQKREIKREYEAIVSGKVIAGGVIKAPIGRHPVKRTHMAVRAGGKEAITYYRIIKRFSCHTHIKVFLETGRTHQIRVHMAHIGYPIVGDPNYSKLTKISEKFNPILRQKLEIFKRQALHAKCLKLHHPTTGKLIAWEAPYPKDFKELLETLEKYD